MKLINVESSNVKSVGYENNTLIVLFKNGGLYKYIDIPETVYDELLLAESIGKYLNTEVKKKKFVCERVWDDDALYKELIPEEKGE